MELAGIVQCPYRKSVRHYNFLYQFKPDFPGVGSLSLRGNHFRLCFPLHLTIAKLVTIPSGGIWLITPMRVALSCNL